MRNRGRDNRRRYDWRLSLLVGGDIGLTLTHLKIDLLTKDFSPQHATNFNCWCMLSECAEF